MGMCTSICVTMCIIPVGRKSFGSFSPGVDGAGVCSCSAGLVGVRAAAPCIYGRVFGCFPLYAPGWVVDNLSGMDLVSSVLPI